ncbi:glycosyltransferase [Candidatus Woesearchaeota archaeon]|nr:glycosyltransferase [Candidatus Woesearchaeota archaeon]
MPKIENEQENKAGLTVVIPTKNDSPDLARCVNSVYKALKNADLVNNSEILLTTHERNHKSIAKKTYTNHKTKIIVDCGKYPLNTSRARNIGIESASYELIGFIDSDCVAQNTWAYQISKTFQEVSDISEIDAIQGIHWLYLHAEKNRFLQAYQEYRRLHAIEHLYPENGNVLTNRLDGRNFAVKTNVAKKLLFDESLPQEQDREFGSRLCSEGYKIRFSPELIVYHKQISFSQLMKKQFKYGVSGAKWRKTKLVDDFKRYFLDKVAELYKGEISQDVFLITLLNNTVYEAGKIYQYAHNQQK